MPELYYRKPFMADVVFWTGFNIDEVAKFAGFENVVYDHQSGKLLLRLDIWSEVQLGWAIARSIGENDEDPGRLSLVSSMAMKLSWEKVSQKKTDSQHHPDDATA